MNLQCLNNIKIKALLLANSSNVVFGALMVNIQQISSNVDWLRICEHNNQ